MLRNSLYMNGIVARAARMLADGWVMRSDVGGIAYVTREDCARAAAVVLSTGGHEARAYDITGPAVVFPQDIARAATEVTGVPIEIQDPEPPGDSEPAPSPPRGSASFAVVSTAVEDLTGRPPESVAELLAANREALLAPAR
jgi:NAD(P)H dehydrogenase (quinone)